MATAPQLSDRAGRRAAPGAVPGGLARRRRRPTPWTLVARAARRRRRRPRRASSTCSTRSVSARCRSRRAAHPARAGADAHDPRGRRGHERARRAATPGAVIGVRGPFGTTWPLEEAPAATSWSSRAGSASRRCARPSTTPSRTATRSAPSACSSGRARRPIFCSCASCESGARASTSRSSVTVDSAGGGLARPRRRRHPADPAAPASTRRRATAFVCRARDHDDASRSRPCLSAACRRSGSTSRMERNMQCGVGHCGHCQLGPAPDLPRRPGVRLRRGGAADARCGSCDGDREQAEPRRLEVLVLRRLPADAARLRGRAARDRRTHSRSRTSPRRRSAEVAGPYDISLVEGSVTTPHDAERILEIREQSRLLVTIGACATAGRHPGAAQLRRREGVDPARLREPRVHLHARDVDTDRGPRRGRPRAARLPDLEGAARRDGARAPQRSRAEPPHHERLLRMQGTRHAVRHGRPRDAVPRRRSPSPVAARSARPTTGAATAASARWRART